MYSHIVVNIILLLYIYIYVFSLILYLMFHNKFLFLIQKFLVFLGKLEVSGLLKRKPMFLTNGLVVTCGQRSLVI